MLPAYQTADQPPTRDHRGVADDGPVTCVWCGTTADEPPVTWTIQVGERGVEHLCERCTRDNVRKIEGSLPTDWW